MRNGQSRLFAEHLRTKGLIFRAYLYYFEGIVEKDGIGTIHCGQYVLDTRTISTAESLVGKKIGVASKDDNTDERTKKMYKFTVKKYVII